jgi:hypothetical protein
VHSARLVGLFGQLYSVEEVDVSDRHGLVELTRLFESRSRVVARLTALPDYELRDYVDLIDELAKSYGAEMWEIEDSVLLLSRRVVPPSSGGDGAGDRSPLVPSRPSPASAIAADPPTDDT